MEEWKPLAMAGYEEKYLVSNYGQVRINNGKILNQSYDSKGYLKVQLYINKKQICRKVHRLVALTFLDNYNDKEQVNHIDGDKTNNNVCNLEWVTCKENVEHAYKTGLSKTGVERHSSKKIVLMNEKNEIISQYSNISTLSKIVNIGDSKIAKTMSNNGLHIEQIDKISSEYPLDLRLNSFYQRHTYCPIAIYDDNMNILAIYSNINLMTQFTILSESIGNKANLLIPIRHKKRGKQFENYYHLKKLTFEEFFLSECKNIDNFLTIS